MNSRKFQITLPIRNKQSVLDLQFAQAANELPKDPIHIPLMSLDIPGAADDDDDREKVVDAFKAVCREHHLHFIADPVYFTLEYTGPKLYGEGLVHAKPHPGYRRIRTFLRAMEAALLEAGADLTKHPDDADYRFNASLKAKEEGQFIWSGGDFGHQSMNYVQLLERTSEEGGLFDVVVCEMGLSSKGQCLYGAAADAY